MGRDRRPAGLANAVPTARDALNEDNAPHHDRNMTRTKPTNAA
jgi:hypothetical protein